MDSCTKFVKDTIFYGENSSRFFMMRIKVLNIVP